MKIKEINEEIKKFINCEANNIQCSINEKVDINSDLFNKYEIYSKNYKENPLFNKLKGCLGIYIFVLNEDIYLDYNTVYNYNECASGGKIYMYSYREADLKKDSCFYIGSASSCSLYSRINQHFKENDGCYSLHFGEEKRKILSDKMKIYVFSVKEKKYDYINILLKGIEVELQKRYIPIAGKIIN